MVDYNQGAVCLLIRESGGSVYQRHRLNIGIYALSVGSIDSNPTNVFTYRFGEPSYAGMADSELDIDIHHLNDFKYIKVERVKCFKQELTEHNIFILTKRGEDTAMESSMLLTKQLEAITAVGTDLKNLEFTANDLLSKYGPRWCESMNTEIFEKDIEVQT